MLPFDDRLPTDTNGDLAIHDWTPLPFYPPPTPIPRGDPTLRRWPPQGGADQTIVGLDAGEASEDLHVARSVAADQSPLLIKSGSTFQAPDLDGFGVPVEDGPVEDGPVEDGADGSLVIKSGSTFQAPDLDPGWHELEEREDQSPLLIKSGATFSAPELDDEIAVTDLEELEVPRALHPAWRWSLNALVVLVPVTLIIGMVLATDHSVPEAAPDLTPTSAPSVHGSLFFVEQAAMTAVAAAKPSAPLPRSVPTAVAEEATSKKETVSPERNGADSRLVPRLLTKASGSARQRRWVRARLWAAAALKISPRNQRARAIRRLAERKLRQHRRHLADARRAMKRGRWSRARAHAKAALRIDPRDRRAKKIKRLAERRQRRRPNG